jgi:hypothetical protein
MVNRVKLPILPLFLIDMAGKTRLDVIEEEKLEVEKDERNR